MKVMACVYLTFKDMHLYFRGWVTPPVPAKRTGRPDTWAPAEGAVAEVERLHFVDDEGRLKPIYPPEQKRIESMSGFDEAVWEAFQS